MTKILTLLSGFGLGALFATTITLAGAAENATKPAYMIAVSYPTLTLPTTFPVQQSLFFVSTPPTT